MFASSDGCWEDGDLRVWKPSQQGVAHDDKTLENRTRGVYGEGGGIGHPEDECAVICEILQAFTLKCFPLKSHKDSNFPAKEQGIIKNVKLVAVRWSESTQKGSVEKKRLSYTKCCQNRSNPRKRFCTLGDRLATVFLQQIQHIVSSSLFLCRGLIARYAAPRWDPREEKKY